MGGGDYGEIHTPRNKFHLHHSSFKMNSVGLRAFNRSTVGVLARASPGMSVFARTVSTAPAPSRKVVNVDRELPDPFADKKQNRRYFWVYSVGVFVLCALIFNYEKTRSPIINSVLYCLRRSEAAKSRLGANIGFSSSWPWVWGPLNTVKGDIDVEFGVKGDKGRATLRLKATRTLRLVPFDIHHFTLETEDGMIDLMKDPTFDFEL